jgi:DNA-binding MarR family transcriptional regulator
MDPMFWFEDLTRDWAAEYADLNLDHSSLPALVRLARLGVLLDAFQHDVLEPFELTPSDYGVLAALRRAGPPYTLKPSQLYSRLRRSSGGMTKILKRLEAAGHIERSPDPEDGRGTRVVLTARGRSLQDRVFQAYMTATSSLMSPLSKRQRHDSEESLGALLAVFEGRAQRRSQAGLR